MDRRSWYMPKATAERLAEAVEELHFTTRQPKHVVLAALIGVALERIPEVEKNIALLTRLRQQATEE